jgi:hypothetical protein
MKKRVDPKSPRYFWDSTQRHNSDFVFQLGFYAGGAVFLLSFLAFRLPTPISLIFSIIPIILMVTLYNSRTNKFNEKISYVAAISDAYRQSIKAAVQCDHPEGVVYILAKTLEQLEMVGINFPPSRRGVTWDDGSSEVIGYPDQSKLKNAIRLAHEISCNWDDITRLGGVSAQIQAMESIHRLIESEDISIHGMRPSFKRVDALYAYSYTEEDYSKGLGRDLISARSSESSPNQPRYHQTDSRPQLNRNSQLPGKIAVLSFQDFTTENLASFDQYLKTNPSLQYLSDQERRQEYATYQQAEYQRYLTAIGAEAPRDVAGEHSPPVQVQPATKDDHDVW